MKRRLAIGLSLALLLVALPWAGFRLWLAAQPPETRIAVEVLSPSEFVTLVLDHYLPRPIEDNAGFLRRDYPGRGHSPWVMRSSLDGRPRMLSLALAPELWLAYSTETASVHQLWQGELDFQGPAFDASHGREPMSRGNAYLRGSTRTDWRVLERHVWHPAQVRWRGHGFDPGSGALWLRFELESGSGRRWTLVERPERIESSGRLGLERRFVLEEGSGPLALALHGGSVESDAEFRESEGLLLLAGGETRVVQWFAAPTIAIDPERATGRAADAFASFDCGTCHDARERTIGPAWGEIALRYEGADRDATAAELAARIREGSRGQWGQAPMTPHPELSRADALALASAILEMEPVEAPGMEGLLGNVESSFDFDVEARPDALHPSLSASRIELAGFRPQVGGLAWLPDGRLVVSTWDRDGAVFSVAGWGGPPGALRVERIAEGLHEPLGLAVNEGQLFVMQKQEITQLLDHDADGRVDEYRTLANDWQATSNFHEFGFGLVHLDGHLHAALSVCILEGGKSCRLQAPDRGRVIRVSLATGEVEFIAKGLRTPNGLAAMPDGSLLVTDNQGDWLPASKLIHLKPGGDYGWRPPGEPPPRSGTSPPALWLPQHEVGNSPTQPVVLTQGPYAGQVLFGDIYNGGIKRGHLEEVGGQLQGAAFHFTGGLQAPVNRLIEASDGRLVAGQIGSRGNWGETDKQWFGLEVLRFSDTAAFEPLALEAVPGGFDLTFGQPLARDFELLPKHFALKHWYYVPNELYGGPKYDETDLPVRSLRVSEDRRVVSLDVPGLEAGRVVYLRMDRGMRSDAGERLFVNEAWYTMNLVPEGAALEVDVAGAPPRTPPNALSASERAAGFRLLFDGESFEGWKIYGAESGVIEGWVVDEGALHFTRDVSFAGLIWNHINPFSAAALDLMTLERFRDFELAIDWKVSPGGNSGIFYRVPDESASLSWTHSVEMQVLDDERHGDGQLDKRRAGDLYDIKAGTRRVTRPAGEWNSARIRVQGDHIEHWLNGEKLLEITRGSSEWRRAIAESKFADIEGFGMAREGHITLQDHGDPVWYRSIKIRALPE
jgi:cytochrome c551/c552